jgi:hypothetical protein
MLKNVASQSICAQLNSKTDGSAVTTGTTTVYILGDAGTQTAGSGTVTHEGLGTWSYVPTQAETNYNHVAYTFVNTLAVTVTQNVYPIQLRWFGIVDDAVTPSAYSTSTFTFPTTANVYAGSLAEVETASYRQMVTVASTSTTASSIVATVDPSFSPALTGTVTITVRGGPRNPETTLPAVNASKVGGTTQTGTDLGLVAPAIKVQTDKFVFTVANQVDANVQAINDQTVSGTGAANDKWRKV